MAYGPMSVGSDGTFDLLTDPGAGSSLATNKVLIVYQ